jgi:hypothetical protein
MKIAYLITSFGNYIHLQRLIESLNDKIKPVFFIHIDKKSSFPSNLLGIKNVHFIKRRKVWWGGWSHTAAIIDLMRASQETGFDYYILISGTDYPIRPNNFLYKKLETGGEYINIIKGFQSHKPEGRIRNYYFDNFDRRNPESYRSRFFIKIEKYLKKVYTKKKYPFTQIYHGSTWWALSNLAVSYILDEISRKPQLMKFFKTSWCPEESLIPTIIGNSKFRLQCKNNLTFTDWSTNPAPAKMTEMHIKLFIEKINFDTPYGKYEPFFARKFFDDSNELVIKIEKQLRRAQ